jgi:hypothetical protein
LVTARAELAELEARAAAMRATWARPEGATNDLARGADEREKARNAVKAERAAVVARARQALVEAERRLAKAAVDRRESIEKEIKSARENFEKASKAAEAAVKPDDAYRRIVGARWTATRFLNSTADDPTVTFGSQSGGRRKALAAWITDRRNPLTARVLVNRLWKLCFGTGISKRLDINIPLGTIAGFLS